MRYEPAHNPLDLYPVFLPFDLMLILNHLAVSVSDKPSHKQVEEEVEVVALEPLAGHWAVEAGEMIAGYPSYQLLEE
jgi:hypothetical protein